VVVEAEHARELLEQVLNEPSAPGGGLPLVEPVVQLGDAFGDLRLELGPEVRQSALEVRRHHVGCTIGCGKHLLLGLVAAKEPVPDVLKVQPQVLPVVSEAAPHAVDEADESTLDGAPEATLLPPVEHPTKEPLEALVEDVVDGEHELDEANVAAERLRDVVSEALPQTADERVGEAPCLEEAGDPVHDLDGLDEVQQVRQEESPADGAAECPQDAGEEEPEQSTLGEDLREAAAKEAPEPLERHPDALPEEGEPSPDEPEGGAGRELECEATDGGGDAAKDSGEDSAPADELLLALGEGSVPVGELAGSLEDPG